jgi:glycosyltransferase involved in cell wall biosynthesis
MLLRELSERRRARVSACLLRPRFVRRFSRTGVGGGKSHLFNADRVLNRFVDYPRFLRERRNQFDLFHIVDHTYAHLADVVGAERCVVTCHDLDAFRPVIEPNNNGRSWFMAKMARRILDGFSRAAAIACDSAATRHDVLRHQLARSERLSVNPNGASEVFTARHDPCVDAEVRRLLGAPERDRVEVLHVGSTIPRKRIDVLLRVFDALRRILPTARLLRVGGAFTPAQRELMNRLALPSDSVAVLPFLSSEVLPAVYRRAAILVLTSESEGFGLPVIEALVCGTPVVLSDIPVLREVGGPAAAYCPVADNGQWTDTILGMLRERRECPRTWAERSAAGTSWAGQFTWSRYADRAAQLYQKIAPN